MARIYSPNEGHSCDYGVDFIHGAAAVPDADTTTIAWFNARYYTIVAGSDTLGLWDLQPVALLREVAPLCGINPTGMTKAQLVAGIEAALITHMKIEITEFDTIPDVDAGKAGSAKYADSNAVKAVLPATVTATIGTKGVKATVPVTAWVDTDTYKASTAGSYTFTATLGTLPLPFANTAAVTATVEVVVASAS